MVSVAWTLRAASDVGEKVMLNQEQSDGEGKGVGLSRAQGGLGSMI